MTSVNLADDELFQLWARLNEKQCDKARQELISHYDYLVKKISASLYSRRIDNDIEFEEFYQLGILGLIESIDRYDAFKGASFDTYASYRIRGSILSGLTKMTEKRQQIAFRQTLANERRLSITEDQSLNSFDELVDLTLGTALSLILEDTALIQNKGNQSEDIVYEHYQLFEYKALLSELLLKLNDTERFVLESHYFEYQSFEMIASVLELSKGRVSQLHKQALNKLKRLFHKERKLDHYY